MPDKPKIMSDFDSTLTKQNSLNILTKKVIKYYLKTGRFGKIIKNLPVLWIRVREIYTSKKLIPEILIFDDSDLVIKKARRLKGVPYRIYKKETIPLLTLNPTWIIECLRYMKKYSLYDEPVTIVSRNGIQEIEDFMKYTNQKNLPIINDKDFLKEVNDLSKKNIEKIHKPLSNEKLLRHFGIRIEIIANKLCKKLVIVDNEKDYIYTGVVKRNHKLGVIERRNKVILYEDNLVLADKEEKIYRTWAKEFTCVQK